MNIPSEKKDIKSPANSHTSKKAQNKKLGMILNNLRNYSFPI
tara:strand:+ start:96 stop:221 length:126 start_codon:yes stop_codon:yes gene_type:complete